MTTTELLLETPQTHDHPSLTGGSGYHLRLAGTAADVLAARRLRFEVFAADGGAMAGPPGADAEELDAEEFDAEEFDADEFDDRCDHLIVWHRTDAGPPQAVATCRLLPPHSNDAEPRGAGLSADREFGLMPLERVLDSTVEVGRAGVRADHRAGPAVSMLWAGVARYLHLTGYRYLLGSAPMDLRDGGSNAASFWDLALTRFLAPAERRCRPRDPISIGGLERAATPQVPAVLAHLMRLGGKICGPPGYDEILGTAAFLVLLDTQAADQRQLRRLLGHDG